MLLSKQLKWLMLMGLVFLFSNSYTQDYNQIWDRINNNQRSAATQILESKMKNNALGIDEFITYNFLKYFDGQESKIVDFSPRINKSENPNAYSYALWFTDPVVGVYGKKNPHQLKLLEELANSNSSNGTLCASAHYSLSHHYLRTNNFAMMKNESAKIGALSNWQFVGPFNNISGSGFNKNYEPIYEPLNNTFLSSENAPIKWFTPMEQSNEGWIFTNYFISDNSSGITFAQTFVNSAIDQDVYLCSGFTGTIKIWVNDQTIIKVPIERITEMDTYNSKCHLNAGFNRILIQIGSDVSDPNFIIRLTDEKYFPLQNITSVAAPQPYNKLDDDKTITCLPLFAETFFESKINNEPNNLVNYILLNKTYLRNNKVFEARQIIEKALKLAPNNTLLKYELSLCYLKENNKTGLSEIYEYFKEFEKESLLNYVLLIQEFKEKEKYQDIIDTTLKRIKLYGDDESTYDDRIQALANLNSTPQMLKLIDEAHNVYPDNVTFVEYIFNVEKNINKNPKKATKILEKFLENHYNYELSKLLKKEYFSQQNTKEAYRLIQNEIDAWPYNPSSRIDLYNELVGQQLNEKAYVVIKDMLKIKPYSGNFYENKAMVEEALGKDNEAIDSYQIAFKYEPTLYSSREKQRILQKKKNLFDLVSSTKIDDLIDNTGKNFKSADYDYYFIQYETDVVLYPEGGREKLHTIAIKINNQRGIDNYSDFSIPYNDKSETLEIEDAYLIKSTGKKTKPEIKRNQLVCTGLEANDVIYLKYRIKVYQYGRFSHEFYDKFIFDADIPVELYRYSIIAPASTKLNYQVLNGELNPEIRELDGYKIYIWEKAVLNTIQNEKYMPPSADYSPTVHISTFDNWNEIAQWYSDVVYSKIANDNDYQVLDVYKKLFDGKINLKADEKARIIYNYIAKNINYSSVSFRQSGITPQKASETINTHLGDCKDISTLFVSLANLCDLKSNLVLVSTRDNGKKDMFLPSFLFNHCIVKYFDEKNIEHYLELTDRDLPFKSLPSNLYQALSLTIPSKDDKESKYNLSAINCSNKTIDKVSNKTKIEIIGSDLNLDAKIVRYGYLSNEVRSKYRSLNQEKVNKEMQESIGYKFSNPVSINEVKFIGLDECLDSIIVCTNYSVVNEVKKIGEQFAFTIPYTDVIFNSSAFGVDKRNYDFEYWNYESTDDYETEIEIELPLNKTFLEIPKSEKLNFNDISYSIAYSKIGSNRLKVNRKAHINRENIVPADYEKFKIFASKIIEIEGAYVSFR